MTKIVWSMETALPVVRLVDERLREVGFFAGLTGGVLRRGSSSNDLDILVVPLDASTPFDPTIVHGVLKGLGWQQTHTEGDLKAIWAEKGSKDVKHVEAWRTDDWRRVDIMMVR